MKTPTGPTPQPPDTSNQSESALKKTLQRLLKKRSSKVNKKLEKDLRRSSSQWQSYTQKPDQGAYPATDQPVVDADLLPIRQPRLSADTEEVCVTAKALPACTKYSTCHDDLCAVLQSSLCSGRPKRFNIIVGHCAN